MDKQPKGTIFLDGKVDNPQTFWEDMIADLKEQIRQEKNLEVENIRKEP